MNKTLFSKRIFVVSRRFEVTAMHLWHLKNRTEYLFLCLKPLHQFMLFVMFSSINLFKRNISFHRHLRCAFYAFKKKPIRINTKNAKCFGAKINSFMVFPLQMRKWKKISKRWKYDQGIFYELYLHLYYSIN